MVVHPSVELLDTDHYLAAAILPQQLTRAALTVRDAMSQKHCAETTDERAQLIRVHSETGPLVSALLDVALQPLEVVQTSSQCAP